MNVLIVDDLYQVVRSMAEGVNWAGLGVDRVLTATSVPEAREVLTQYPVSLLLCDIEMPPNNGFELVEWAQNEGIEIETLFLTSHAEFEYARKAMKLGSLDYILQPARYEDVEAAARRAIERIEAKHRSRQAEQDGRYWHQRRDALSEACLARFFHGGGEGVENLLEELQRLDHEITRETSLCPVLFQPHRSVRETDITALKRELTEHLDRTEKTMLVCSPEEDCLLALLYNGSVQWGEIVPKLETLVGEKPEGESRLACYCGEAVRPEGLYDQWHRLRDRMRGNVAHYGGVFAPMQRQEFINYIYTFPDMRRWARLLSMGECDRVRSEALGYLEEQRAQSRITAEFLARFHQDFMQMFFTAAENAQVSLHEVFYKEYPFDDFLEAYTSYNKMIDLVRFTLDYVGQRLNGKPERISPVAQAERFIRENIEKDIHRSDVAEAIFMNEDYLARLFKKEKGISLHDFIVSEKMREAATLLEGTMLPVSLIASKVGYPNFSYFSQAFKKQTGMTPGEYRTAKRK